MRRMLTTMLICLFLCFGSLASVDAGNVKGWLYNQDGTLFKDATGATVDVYDAASGTKLASGKSAIDASFTVTYDSTKVSTTGNAGRTVYVVFTKNGRTTTLQGVSSAGTGTKIGGILGTPAYSTTLHVIVVGD